MAPTFFLKQFGLSQVSSDEASHEKPQVEVQENKVEKPPKISPLRYLLDDTFTNSFKFTDARPSVKELSTILKLTKFWVHMKPLKSKPILKRLILSSIPADAEPVFHEPQCLDCHKNDDGCDHCELPHECDRTHVTSDMLIVAVAHPNALGEQATGTFYRDGDTIYQWNGVEDVAIFLPLTNLESGLHYRFIY